jgi:hypothetical protein
MILSSADILRVLGGDAIVRQEARVEVVKDRPGLGTDDTVYVYVEKYPSIEEFEAVWRIWILDNSGMGQYILKALTSLLPSFQFNGDHYTVREFASERTVVKSQAEKDHEELQKERAELRTELNGLQAGVEDRLKAVRDGVDGKDGKDGRDGVDGKDGKDGRDGKDVDGTQLELFQLSDVESGIPLEKGQVLTWDGSDWTNLFVPQLVSTTVGGSSGGSGFAPWQVEGQSDLAPEGEEAVEFVAGEGISITTDPAATPKRLTITSNYESQGEVLEAPQDGNYYVRQNAQWVNLNDALTALGVIRQGDNIDNLVANTGSDPIPAGGFNLLGVDKSDGSIFIVEEPDVLAPE